LFANSYELGANMHVHA